MDITDATLIQRYDIQLAYLDGMQRKAADVDGDDEATIIDVALIQRYASDMNVKYPINEYV